MGKGLNTMLLSGLVCTTVNVKAQSNEVHGVVKDKDGFPISSVQITTKNGNNEVHTSDQGTFSIPINKGVNDSVTLYFEDPSFQKKSVTIAYPYSDSLLVTLVDITRDRLTDVEVFGRPKEQPDKLDLLTGLPVQPSQQIQSVSVISNRVIKEQDIQNLADATRNVTGVTEFSSFGDVVTSLTIRGMRGVPILMNGVNINNDSRGHGVMPDMEGVDNIQVLKGSAAITQGLSSMVGSAGGVVNVVTKTPHFINAGNVGLRYGSWNNFRGTVDIQRVLNPNLAFRIDAAAQKGDNYRKYTKNDRFYINPSLVWHPDQKTEIIMEMDYLHDNRTPDRGTVNLGADSVNNLWKIPDSKFLGFSSDHSLTNMATWGLRFKRALTNNIDLKVDYYGTSFKQDFNSAVTVALNDDTRNMRYRYLNRVTENDKSNYVRVALVGHDLYTGKIKHTFQAGFDYRSRSWYSQTFNSNNIDTINIFDNYTNNLIDQNLTYTENKGRYYNTNYTDYGLYGQDMVTFNKYLTAIVGARYSYGTSLNNKTNSYGSGKGVNPILGLFVSPVKNVNFFGSYTTVSAIANAQQYDANGKLLGNSVTHQVEAGFKSSHFNDHLRFNFTYFYMNNSDYTYQVTNTTTNAVYYNQSGNLKRQGIETELIGHIIPELEVLLGYTHLSAKYENVKTYVDGSAPMGAPKDMANAWVNYSFYSGALNGLSVGAGLYYLGKRPVDDYQASTTASVTNGGAEIQHTAPGVKPFDLKAYTTLNASLAYRYNQYTFRATLNNITNSRGIISYYNQAFINLTPPTNYSFSINYSF